MNDLDFPFEVEETEDRGVSIRWLDPGVPLQKQEKQYNGLYIWVFIKKDTGFLTIFKTIFTY